jgi:hypothetical protein
MRQRQPHIRQSTQTTGHLSDRARQAKPEQPAGFRRDELVRFFASGTLENENGPLQMPEFSRDRLESLKIPIRSEWIGRRCHNGCRRAREHQHDDLAEVRVEHGRVVFKTDQRGAPSDNNVNSYYYNALTGPGFIPKDSRLCQTTPLKCLAIQGSGPSDRSCTATVGSRPRRSSSNTRTKTSPGSAERSDAIWRPFTWLMNDGTVGVDITSANNLSHCFLNECADFSTTRQGTISDEPRERPPLHGQDDVHTATWQALHWINLKTSVGGDYLNSESEGTTVSANTLGPGVRTVQQGQNRRAPIRRRPPRRRSGVFVQEQFEVRDRLFLTGAVRTDQNSAFGRSSSACTTRR